MKLKTGIRLLGILGTRPNQALTTHELVERWRGEKSRSGGKGEDVSLRSMQRYVHDLSENDAGGVALVKKVGRKGEQPRYYLQTDRVANWFMTEAAALDLQLAQQVYGSTLGRGDASNAQQLADLTERVIEASPETKRLRDRLRIVPDGIGRLPAEIDHTVLREAIAAISMQRQIQFTYADSKTRKPASKRLTPLGLVAKDGTVYLVAVDGLSDAPRHYAMQRMADVTATHRPAQDRPEFNLGRYIQETHQFSHVLDHKQPPVTLKLHVDEATIFHFKERPLAEGQRIRPVKSGYVVTAKIPKTFLLRPFLASMGPGIEVVEPADVRQELAEWVQGMWACYAQAGKAK